MIHVDLKDVASSNNADIESNDLTPGSTGQNRLS